MDELGKGLHSICAATNTNKLWEVERGGLDSRVINTRLVPLIWLRFTNLNIAKHFGEIVRLGAQAEVVEDVLLHGIQVGIFHLDLFSKSNLVQHINRQLK